MINSELSLTTERVVGLRCTHPWRILEIAGSCGLFCARFYGGSLWPEREGGGPVV